MRLTYGIMGPLFAINAVYFVVVTSELLAEGDVGVLATAIVMVVLSIFCLRRAFKSASP